MHRAIRLTNWKVASTSPHLQGVLIGRQSAPGHSVDKFGSGQNDDELKKDHLPFFRSSVQGTLCRPSDHLKRYRRFDQLQSVHLQVRSPSDLLTMCLRLDHLTTVYRMTRSHLVY